MFFANNLLNARIGLLWPVENSLVRGSDKPTYKDQHSWNFLGTDPLLSLDDGLDNLEEVTPGICKERYAKTH
jgi:hypothetical protein